MRCEAWLPTVGAQSLGGNFNVNLDPFPPQALLDVVDQYRGDFVLAGNSATTPWVCKYGPYLVFVQLPALLLARLFWELQPRRLLPLQGGFQCVVHTPSCGKYTSV